MILLCQMTFLDRSFDGDSSAESPVQLRDRIIRNSHSCNDLSELFYQLLDDLNLDI